jgi:hypothetical protein
MAIYVCERRFDKPLRRAVFETASTRLLPCLEAREVTWIASYFADDGLRAVCLFDAPDAESIREAVNTAGNPPFQAIWPSESLRP